MTANTNTVKYKFSDYPYNGSTQLKDVSDNANVLTYGLQIVKFTGTGANKKYLEGAEFSLFTDASCSNQVHNIAVDSTGKLISATPDSVVTDSSGKAYFGRLAPGTYYLKETKAPVGYNVLTEAKTVIITADQSATGENIYKVAVADSGTEKNGYATIEVENRSGFTLPSTGGTGTVVFCVIGIAFMMIAIILIAVFLISSLKKKSKSNR